MFARNDLDSAEFEARRAIEHALGPLLKLADETQLLIFETIDAVAKLPRSGPDAHAASKVSMILAVRSANDLRACSILARDGYGLQAMGLAATSVELAGTLAYVGDSEERAIEWAKHSNQRKSYPGSVADGIDALSHALGLTGPNFKEMKERWTRIYTALCMAKHSNPRLSLRQGLRFDSDGAYFGVGPDASRFGVKLSYIAVYQAMLFTLEGLWIFSGNCNDSSRVIMLREKIKEIQLRIEEVYQALSSIMTPSPFDDE